ncbi:acyloxyacyl hydrolase [Candidatus Deferrimicrobium sp.]
MEIAYRLGERTRVGIEIAHVSNAGVYENNPGGNDLFATFSFGF